MVVCPRHCSKEDFELGSGFGPQNILMVLASLEQGDTRGCSDVKVEILAEAGM